MQNTLGFKAKKIKTALFIFVSVLLSIYFTKPSWLFDDHTGKRREFGLGFNRDGEKKTLFDMTIVVVVTAIIAVVISSF